MRKKRRQRIAPDPDGTIPLTEHPLHDISHPQARAEAKGATWGIRLTVGPPAEEPARPVGKVVDDFSVLHRKLDEKDVSA